MNYRKVAMSAAAIALITAPVAVEARGAVKRSARAVEQESELAAIGTPVTILLAALAALSVYAIVDDGDDDPVSNG